MPGLVRRGALLVLTLERYAKLPGDFIAALGGDRILTAGCRSSHREGQMSKKNRLPFMTAGAVPAKWFRKANGQFEARPSEGRVLVSSQPSVPLPRRFIKRQKRRHHNERRRAN